MHHGKAVTDKSEIVNIFNNFFVNIGPELSSKIVTQDKKPFTSYLKKNITSVFEFSFVEEDATAKIIKSLKNKPSAGHDGISLKFLKSIAPSIINPLTLIINQSLTTGIFPTSLKIAKVIPLFKKDSHEIVDNYRPVSLLTSLSKVFEKAVYIQLSKYFNSNNLFYNSQYGFREDHSTEHASLELIDKITTDLEKKTKFNCDFYGPIQGIRHFKS